jgi:lipid-binding SYLF domain-containing protein
MNHLRKILLAGLMAGFALPVSAESLDKLIPQATEIFGRFKREDILNMDLVKEAKGIVIINITGFAIGIGGSGGDGILMARTEDGGWSGPVAITTDGGTMGIDVGGTDNDVVVLLMNNGAVSRWASGDHFGSSSAQAVMGPKGGAAVDATMKTRDFNVYIWNKGAKLGVNWGGFDVNINDEANANYYDKPLVSAKDILNGLAKVPESKKDSIDRLYGLLK